MAESPSIKIQREYEDPPNISAEVPGEQQIRETDSNYEESTVDVSTSSEVDTDYTLSPVITVTKNETTLTKGDLKLQKVTVKEDIAIQEAENGGHRISYAGVKTSVQTYGQSVTRTISTTESRERRVSASEEKKSAAKKSKIPLLNFKQTVEKVQKERQKQKLKDQPHHKRRRSSIPKLKDAKAVKRTSSLKVETTSSQKLEDEFDKLYEQVVDNNRSSVDDKILAVNIDDPEKLETKFEEIIHAYDNNDNNYLTASEKVKISKIPWRKKDNAGNKTVDKNKTTVSTANLKDGGFKVSATTITTKRFSRGNSVDVSKTQKLGVVETSCEQNPKDNETFNVTATQMILDNTGKTKTTIHAVKTATSLRETVGFKKIDNIENSKAEATKCEEFEGGHKIIKETITRIPIKPERVSRNISRDLNRRPAKLDEQDLVTKEVVSPEEFEDDSSHTIVHETVITEPQIRTEKMTRSISRTFSRDGKSITLSSQSRQSYNENNNRHSTENNELDVMLQNSIQNSTPSNNFQDIGQNEADNDTKESTKIPSPITKTTHSYIKSSIRNIERSKSVEWKAADEVLTKKYSKTVSENKFTKNVGDDTRLEATVEQNNNDTSFTQIKTINQSLKTENVSDENYIEMLNDDEQPLHTSNDSTDTLVSSDQVDLHLKTNNSHSTSETIENSSEISETLPTHDVSSLNKDSNMQKVTILKGNVNRLITQLSEQDPAVTKKDIDIKEELPKKKSVLSKIAIFEGKDAAEYTIKIKKCSIDNKISENIEQKVSRVDNVNITQPDLDYLNNNVYISNGNNINTDQRTVNDGPVIVDQIWKYQEESVSTVHQVGDVKILPQAIDFTISESNFDVKQSFTEATKSLSVDKSIQQNVDYREHIRLLPEKIDFIHSEEKVEGIKASPEIINFGTGEKPNSSTKINVGNENQGLTKYTLDKSFNENIEDEKKVQKLKVGKLNLDLWNKQIEVNKQLISKGKTIEPNESVTKAQTISTTKIAYKKGLNDNEVSNKRELQSESVTLPSDEVNISEISKNKVSTLIATKINKNFEQHSEIPTILPFRRDIKYDVRSNEAPKLLQEKNDFSTKEGQLQVPIILPETPLTISTKLKFESQKSQLEIPVPVSYTTEVKTNIYTAETTNIVLDSNTSETPAQCDHSFETQRIMPAKIEIATNNENGFEKPKIFPERIDFKTNKDEEYIVRALPDTLFLNPSKKDEPNQKIFKVKDNVDDLDKEVPSDPELVDSEPEIRDTKDTIMGKLKNKIFLITSRNAKKKYTEKSSTPTTPSVDDYTSKTEFSPVLNEKMVLKDKFENSHDVIVTNYRVQNSIHDFEEEYESRDDIKRTKSLAELDLGDAVIGQVRRMVHRIKSVDFDKIETSRTRKISLREMPKKSSVLEKIALFEGKASATTAMYTRSLEFTTTSKNFTAPSSQGLTEEMYLRKIEDLSTVKMRYHKTDMLYLSLGNGGQMPAIALGTALLDPRLAPHVVSAAIDLGYRAIDTAFIYGTEELVGQGIKNKIDDGTVTREELFIAGKLWSTFHKPELVETACRASLKALGLDYFDLYMIHNPMSLKEGGDPIPQIANVLQFSQYDYLDAWFAMEALVSKGLVKAIGVSNFNSQQIQKIIDKGHIKPLVNQVECHPYLTQQPLQNFCKERNITLSCFSVLGSKGTPAEYKSGVTPPIDDPLVKVMASGLNVTPAQLLVRYQIQSGRQAVIKATSPGHLYDILQALTFVLEPHQIDALNALNRNKRILDMKKLGEMHKNYPFNVPF